MRPRFISFVERFNINFTYSTNFYLSDSPLTELTFICPVKWNILQEEKDPGHGVSLRAKSISNYMEVYLKSQSGFDRPITMCSWEFMKFHEECGEPDIPLNSKITGFWEKNRVDYKCVESYTLIKNNDGHIAWDDPKKLYNEYIRRCGVDGDWFDEPASCKPDVFCTFPHDKKYLKASYKNHTYFNSTLVAIPGTIATFNCIPDYAKKGTWNSICSENGTWIGEEAFCPEQDTVSPQTIIIISLSTVLIIGGLLGMVTFFIVMRRFRRLQKARVSGDDYDDINDKHRNEYYYASENYEDLKDTNYENVNYEDLKDVDLKKREQTASYLSLH